MHKETRGGEKYIPVEHDPLQGLKELSNSKSVGKGKTKILSQHYS